MYEHDLTWLIGGPQGGGVDTSGNVFARFAVRSGLRVFANTEVHSNISGEHAYFRVRLSDHDRNSILDRVNVLVALDAESLSGDPHLEFVFPESYRGHIDELLPGGVAIYDSASRFDPSQVKRTDVTLVGIPLLQVLRDALKDFGRENDANRLRVITNTVAMGASIFALGGDIEAFAQVFLDDFRGARAEVGQMNARAAALGYGYAAREMGKSTFDLKTMATQASREGVRPMLMRGMHACALGKLKAGLHLQTYYPISPATDESVYLEGLQRDQNFLVVQCEDEIAAMQMAIGAANAGARAATSTSGPGFALMVEGIGYASMTEVGGPVVFLWQRGGPSTGLPTRQDQGDLRWALHPAQGDFPHIVVAPGDHQEAFDDSFEAFNWADRYHVPVIVLLDKNLSTQSRTIDGLKMDNLVIDRGPRFQPNEKVNGGAADGYLRYQFTETGVTPRSFPGEEGGIFWATSDEHDQRGHITEDAENRIRMMEKRMRKLEVAEHEIQSERKVGIYGSDDAEVTIVGWGSTKGVILDAMDVLENEDGVESRFVQVRLMRPFPVEEVTRALAGAKRLILVENSYSGQLGGVVREMTGIELRQKVLKYDGRPFSQEEMVEALREAIRTKKNERVHVSHRSG